MGKVKRDKVLRKQEVRVNPVGIPSLKDIEDAEREGVLLESSNTASNFVQSVLEQLKNPMVEERDSGLNSLSMVVENPKILKELLENHVLELAAPLLMDQSLIVRHSAAGAFRNLSSLGPDILDLMSSKEILRPLAQLLKTKYGPDWSPQTPKNNNTDKTKLDSLTDCFIQAVNAVWNICEHSQESLDFFKNEGVFTVILKHLNTEAFGLKVAIAVAQCMNTATEGNKEIVPNFAEMEIFLQNILSEDLLVKETVIPDWVYYQVLVIGIILNLHDGQISKLQPAYITKITQKLSAVLELNHIQEIKSFTSIVPISNIKISHQNGKGNASVHEEELSSENQEKLDTKAEEIKVLLDAQTMSLELLSNILFIDDESDSSEFEDEGEDCVIDELMMSEIDGECMSNGAIQSVEMNGLDPGFVVEVHEGIKNFDMIAKVNHKTHRLPENVYNILENNKTYGKPLLCKLNRLQSTALICFQNMIGGFSIEDLGGVVVLRNIWKDLVNYLKEEVTDNKETNDTEFLVSSTSCLRGIVQKVLDEQCPNFFENLSLDLVTVFFQLYQRNISPILTNLIRIIGGLGVLISKEKNPTEEHRKLIYVIGEFLLNCVVQPAHHDNPIGIAEALDIMFDVFAEEDYNQVIRELGMIQKLKNFGPQFRKMIRFYRKQLGDNKAIVETARTNLTRFIDYKIKHGAA